MSQGGQGSSGGGFGGSQGYGGYRPQGNPWQRYGQQSQGWQPSFGGNQPTPFMGQQTPPPGENMGPGAFSPMPQYQGFGASLRGAQQQSQPQGPNAMPQQPPMQQTGGNDFRNPMTANMFDAMKPMSMGQPPQQAIGDPYRAFGPKPMQMQPQQWQPSYGGNQPTPFMGQGPQAAQAPQTGGNEFFGSQARAPQAPQQSYQQWQQQNAGMIRPQQDMGEAAWQAQQPSQQKLGQPGQPPRPQMPPMPTGPMQNGQGAWKYGPPPMGTRESQFDWQPSYLPDQNGYIVQSINNANGSRPPWINQVNWNDAVNSIGQLSGNPYTSNRGY